MNLFFLDSIDIRTYGGMEEWIRLVAAGLARRGHSVTVAGRQGSEFLSRLAADQSGVSLFPLDISGDFSPATISQLASYFTERRIDLLSVNFNKDIRLGGIAARLKKHPRVVWSVGLDIAKDTLIHKMLTPRLVDSVLVPSESLKNQLTGHGYIPPEMVTVIPIGIPDWQPTLGREEARIEMRRKYHLPADSIVALTSGRFVDQKGHRYLIEAAPRIVVACPSVRFLLLGDGPLQSDLQQQVESAGLSDHFVFAGMLRDFDLELQGADLMIHPSIEEPFGIVLLEAMRAALPVAASRVGGISEVVAELNTAVLFPPCDPFGIVHAVVPLLSDPALRARLGSAARARFENQFRCKTMIDRIETFFLAQVTTAGCTHGTA